ADVLVRSEHEVIEEQLPAPLEQVEQRGLAARPVEDVVLVDPDPRQPTTLGGERVSCPGGFLFLGKERLPRCLPLRLGDDRWKVHGAPFSGSSSSRLSPGTRPCARRGAARVALSAFARAGR